jgi:glycosyltransferase involved in cell wall biosynthesis
MFILLLQMQTDPNPDYANMAAGLRARGHEVWLGMAQPNGELAWGDGARARAVTPGPLPDGLPANGLRRRAAYARFWGRLRTLIRTHRPDVVQVDPGATLLPWLLPVGMPRATRFIFDVKQINLGVRADPIGRLKEWQLVKSWQFCGRAVYDHTLFDYELAAAALLGPRWRRWATVTPVGINPELLQATRPPARPDGVLRCVYIGGLSRFRELERLLEAAQLAARQTDRFQIDFVGPDQSAGYYAALIERLGLPQRVRIKPPVPYAAIPQLIAGYDLGLAYNPDRPTWHYQPTIKVKEYRAVGLPILSTDVMAHRDFVEAGVNGLLVPNTPQAWAEALLRFVADPPFYDRCDHNARRMRQGVTIAEVAAMHERVYRALGVHG